jgi:hypothetical protein
LAATFCASLLVSVAHFALAHRFPYPRVCGYFLPPIIIGYGCLVQRLGELFVSQSWRGLAWTGWALATAAVAAPGLWESVEDQTFVKAVTAASQLGSRADVAGGRAYVILGSIDLWPLGPYLPRNWLDAGEKLPLSDKALVCVLAWNERPTWRGIPCEGSGTGKSFWDPRTWRGPVTDTGSANLKATILSGSCEPFDERAGRPCHALVFWYPELRSVTVSPDKVLDFLDSCRVKYLVANSRYQAKMEVHVRLSEIILLTECAQDWTRVEAATRSAIELFGGDARVFAAPQSASTAGPCSQR